MCLIAFAWQAHAGLPLVFASNRDESFDRPTATAAWWEDAPQVLAGRDLQAGGTWMGVTRTGRFAALTNFRAPNERNPVAPSRGPLVADFLKGSANPECYLQDVAKRVERQSPANPYNGFSLLVGDVLAAQLWLYSNRSGLPPQPLAPGVYGLSNALLDTPWPKLLATRDALRIRLQENSPRLVSHLLDALANPALASEFALPATGVSPELERQLSAAFIQPALRAISGTPYGTRTSTVLTIGYGDKAGSHAAPHPAPHATLHATMHATFHERTFDALQAYRDQTFAFNLTQVAADK